MSKHFDIGMEVGRFNVRGVTTRGFLDGGATLPNQYRKWADIVGDLWLRTGRLRHLADSYARDARREDESAERAGDED
jgi:hypothetical protein